MGIVGLEREIVGLSLRRLAAILDARLGNGRGHGSAGAALLEVV